jgi:hypothetical protein
MASKARFQKLNSSAKLPVSTVGGSGSTKKSGATGAGYGFGNELASTGRGVQVIYNGKIVTPVSLHARPKAAVKPLVAKSETKIVQENANNDVGVEEEKADKVVGLSSKQSAGTRSS